MHMRAKLNNCLARAPMSAHEESQLHVPISIGRICGSKFKTFALIFGEKQIRSFQTAGAHKFTRAAAVCEKTNFADCADDTSAYKC